MRLTKAEQQMTKSYDNKVYVDWEGAMLDLCVTKEDITKYKKMKALAKKVYADNDNNDTGTVISA